MLFVIVGVVVVVIVFVVVVVVVVVVSGGCCEIWPDRIQCLPVSGGDIVANNGAAKAGSVESESKVLLPPRKSASGSLK